MTGSAFWDANIRFIGTHYPGLAEQIGAAEEEGLRLEASAAGPPTLAVQGVHIHSPRDPVREGRRLAEAFPRGRAGPVVILGFGLGYAAEALGALLAGAREDRPLIIVERRTGVLKKALESRDLTGFLGRRRLVFVTGEESGGITAALRLFEGEEGGRSAPAVLRNRALTALDQEWYAGVERRISLWASRGEVNQATLRRFGKRWVRNLAANLEAIRDLPGVSRLEGLLAGTGIPVFLAAAGPSLEKTGPLAVEIARRCLVVAVDTSLRFLLNAGVDPDFTLVVDPQYWNSRHLDHAPAARTCLVAESAVYPPVLRHPFGRAFLCGSLFPLGRFIEDRVDPKGDLGAGGSVATTAWDFARLLGGETIFIAGLDLAFPGLKTHFKGARFEEQALAEAYRLDPAETRSVRALRDGGGFRAPGAGGEPVLTDRRLSLYAAWFENRFRAFPGIRNYRLGREGLAIPGLESLGMEEVLREPERREEIDRRLAGAFAAMEGDFFGAEAVEQRSRDYEKAREALVRGLEEIENTARTGAALAAKGRRTGGGGRILRELEAATRALTENPVKAAAGFLFPPAAELEAGLETPVSDPFGRHLEFSEKFFRALSEAASYPLGLLR